MSLEADFRKSTKASTPFGRQIFSEILEECKKIDQAFNNAVYEFCATVINRTPVGMPETWGSYWRAIRGVNTGAYQEGHLVMNWQFSKNAPKLGEISGVDPKRVVSKSRVKSKLDGVGTYYLTNSADYASTIEYRGYSNQAPQGMLRITEAEWPAIKKKYGLS